MKENKTLYQYNNRRLCSLEKEHIFKLKKWRNAQIEILRQSELLSDSDQEKWYSSLEDDKTQVLFALISEGEFIGYCGLTNIDYKNKRAEVSFLVETNRSKQKEVYRKDLLAALYMLCEHGFEQIELNRIFIDTYEFRKKHIEILEEFGFQKEGKLRQHYFDKNRYNKYINSFIHSILSSEWNKRRLNL